MIFTFIGIVLSCALAAGAAIGCFTLGVWAGENRNAQVALFVAAALLAAVAVCLVIAGARTLGIGVVAHG